MANPRAAAADGTQDRRERRLRSLESRIDDLETDLGSVLAGGAPRPAPPSRSARLSRWLIVAGALLILVAIALAIA